MSSQARMMMLDRVEQPVVAQAAALSLTFAMEEPFDFTSAAYAGLFARSAATAFQHPVWLSAMYTHLAGANSAAKALVARSAGDGRMLFVLPLIERRRLFASLHDAAHCNVSDYNAMVVDPELSAASTADPAVCSQIAGALSRLGLLRISRVRQDTFDADAAMRTLHHSHMGFHAHEIRLEGDFASWKSSKLETGFSRLLDKNRKRLLAKGANQFKEVLGDAAIEASFRTMREFRRTRWAGDKLADAAYFDFYLDVAKRGSRCGLARTYQLSVGDDPIAILFGVVHQGRFCFVLHGFESVKYRNSSAGSLIIENVIADNFARGDTIFDLTIGDEGYKKNFSVVSTPMLTVWGGIPPLPKLAGLVHTAVVKRRALKQAQAAAATAKAAEQARSAAKAEQAQSAAKAEQAQGAAKTKHAQGASRAATP